MPNVQHNNGYRTEYVITVNYESIDKGYQSFTCQYGYSDYMNLSHLLNKIILKEKIKIRNPFPTRVSTFFASVMGDSDESRYERMTKLDAWMKEIVLNPMVMTDYESFCAIYDFLRIKSSCVM